MKTGRKIAISAFFLLVAVAAVCIYLACSNVGLGVSKLATASISFTTSQVCTQFPLEVYENSRDEWKRICSEPFPIYVKNPGEKLEFKLDHERIYLNGRLYGLVIRDYTDLERNASLLSEVVFLMSYARLVDDRTHQFVRKLSSLRAVTIYSPMPGDIEVLSRFVPDLEVLDLNCLFWNCECDLSSFARLSSLSVRGKMWKSACESNESTLGAVRKLYLQHASVKDLENKSSSLRALEISIYKDAEIGTLAEFVESRPKLTELHLNLRRKVDKNLLASLAQGSVSELFVLYDDYISRIKSDTLNAILAANPTLLSINLKEIGELGTRSLQVVNTASCFWKGKKLALNSFDWRRDPSSTLRSVYMKAGEVKETLAKLERGEIDSSEFEALSISSNKPCQHVKSFSCS